MQCTLKSFPLLNGSEFEAACSALSDRFRLHGHKQDAWLSVEPMQSFETRYLRVTKHLDTVPDDATDLEDELEDDDAETLTTPPQSHTHIVYDILLSPAYRVPVLYFRLLDPQHRFPPTMATLYEHVIPPQYRAQTEHVGVIGGITIVVSTLLWTKKMALMHSGPSNHQQPSLLRASVPDSRRLGSLRRHAPCGC
jgi:ubiquitin-like-conjugating enzyme ATG10